MAKKNRNSKQHNKPGQHASKQGVGETYDWIVNDLAVVPFRSSTPEQLTVTVACDVNGYNYNTYYTGTNVDESFPILALPEIG
jgi:hypothetical protein